MHEVQNKKAKEVYNHFLDNKFDALVMPGFAVPAPKLGSVDVCFLLTFRVYNIVPLSKAVGMLFNTQQEIFQSSLFNKMKQRFSMINFTILSQKI